MKLTAHLGGITVKIKKHNTMGSSSSLWLAMGIVFGAVFDHIILGMIIGLGIGSAFDLMNYSRKTKHKG
jgi:hypothetical protein